MPEPTASLTFVLTGGNLVFSGNDDANPLGLVSMTEPGMVPRSVDADLSAQVEGSLPTASVWQVANILATVGLKATSQTTLEAQKAALKAACAQFRHVVVTEVNGYQQSWTAGMTAMVPAGEPDDYANLRDFEAFYDLTIPVQPTPEVV